MTKILNDRLQKTLRQALRSKRPQPEIRLWKYLRARQLHGFKFRRQYSIGSYVVDFYCPTASLVIEIDGESHFGGAQILRDDRNRQNFIESQGLRVLRFTNTEVRENIEGILLTISEFLECNTSLSPSSERREAGE